MDVPQHRLGRQLRSGRDRSNSFIERRPVRRRVGDGRQLGFEPAGQLHLPGALEQLTSGAARGGERHRLEVHNVVREPGQDGGEERRQHDQAAAPAKPPGVRRREHAGADEEQRQELERGSRERRRGAHQAGREEPSKRAVTKRAQPQDHGGRDQKSRQRLGEHERAEVRKRRVQRRDQAGSHRDAFAGDGSGDRVDEQADDREQGRREPRDDEWLSPNTRSSTATNAGYTGVRIASGT